MGSDRHIVFYDGECPFCIGWVKFLLDRDGHDRFRFAALQGDWARKFFAEHGLTHPGMDSVAVWDGEALHRTSAAVAALAEALPGIWHLGRHIRSLPESWREGAYDFVARNRYNWFGRRKACWVPGPDERAKFMDQQPAGSR